MNGDDVNGALSKLNFGHPELTQGSFENVPCLIVGRNWTHKIPLPFSSTPQFKQCQYQF